MIFNWQGLGIDISKVRGGKTICPNCSHTRKHKNDLCLSVDLQTGLYNCHNGCGFKGSAIIYQKPKKEYVKPAPRLEKVSEKIIKFFEERGISNNTILRFGITEANEWMPQFEKETQVICFNYYRNEELVNIKFRGAKKAFKMAKDAELIFYNLDSIKDESEVVIVEGEIDCLTMHECGIYNSISVPNGANKGNQKLEYLDNCWQYFENKTKIILAVDGDEAGNSLKEELARRLGKDICYLVNYPDGCKDANEVLLKYGKESVLNLVKSATLYPLEGEITIEEMGETLIDYYENGYPPGCAAGIQGFDEYLTFVSGQLTMITGIPGSGKDEFVNNIITGLAINHDWVTGIFGYEEPPQITATKLIEKFAGKSFGFRKDPSQRVSQNEFERGLLFVDKYFKLINTDEVEATIDGIIEKAKQLVKRYGIKCLVISPWNCLEHNMERGESETSYISRVLGKLLSFIKKYGIHCFLIAHPTKLQKDKQTKKYEVPTLYSISGSAHFFNKTHNGMSIYRDFETNIVDVYVQKVKWSWLGKLGFCSFRFDTYTRQYISL